MARIDIRDYEIQVKGDTHAIIMVPRYVSRALRIFCGSTYYTLDHKDFIKCLDRFNEYIEKTPYEQWVEALRYSVPKRYVKNLVNWLFIVKSYIEEEAPLVEYTLY